jgi:tetratricopeptide (TPR) repeat protein
VIACGLFAVVLAASAGAGARAGSQSFAALARVQQLYAEKKYSDIIRLPPPGIHDPPDFDFYRGMAFARLKRWTEAWQWLRQGEIKAPRDERFPVEMAGVDFEQKRFSRAKSEVHRALRLDPTDGYADNFLASLYYLDGNLGAALKYWNRIAKPQIHRVRSGPQPALKRALFHQAVGLSAGETLTLPDYRAALQRIHALGVFPQFRLELLPDQGQGDDVVLHALELNGWGDSKAESLLSIFRGLPYDTVYPELYNIHHSATNLVAMLRWDPNKERIFAALSGPIAGSARTRYQFYVDGRREAWDISHTFFGSASPLTGLRMEKVEGGAEIVTLVNSRLAVRGGIDVSGRSFGNFETRQPAAAAFFANGLALKTQASGLYHVIDFPDRRFTLDSTGSIQAGRDFARALGNSAQTQAGVSADWLPQARSEDYEMTAQVRAGYTFGMVPFDDLFMLGLERDNNLWLRGQIGTANGRKGSAPLGRDYILTNWEDDKIILHNGVFRVRLGPFLDSGRITDPSGNFGLKRWQWDTGLELKVRVLGSTEVALFFGKDLLSGHTSFYATTLGFQSRTFPPGPTPFWGY